MQSLLLAVLLWLTPPRRQPSALPRLTLLAGVVAQVTRDPDAQALLLALALYENGWDLLRGGVPFGVTACRRCVGQGLPEHAQTALVVLARAEGACPWPRPLPLPVRLGYFHSGRCAADAFSVREAGTVRRVRATLGWWRDAAHGWYRMGISW